jgi:hypothetical protein
MGVGDHNAMFAAGESSGVSAWGPGDSPPHGRNRQLVPAGRPDGEDTLTGVGRFDPGESLRAHPFATTSYSSRAAATPANRHTHAHQFWYNYTLNYTTQVAGIAPRNPYETRTITTGRRLS